MLRYFLIAIAVFSLLAVGFAAGRSPRFGAAHDHLIDPTKPITIRKADQPDTNVLILRPYGGTLDGRPLLDQKPGSLPPEEGRWTIVMDGGRVFIAAERIGD